MRRKLYIFIINYKKYIFLLFILMIISAVLELPLPFFMKYLIDVVLPQKNMNNLIISILILIIFLIIKYIFDYFSSNFKNYIGQKFIYDLRRKIFEYIIKMEPAFFDEKDKGDIISRYMNDIGALNSVITYVFPVFLSEGIFLLVISFAIIKINFYIFLYIFIYFVCYSILYQNIKFCKSKN